MFQSPPRTEPFKTGVLPAGENRLELPGYGLPIDYIPVKMNVYGVQNKSLFPTSLDDRDIQKGYADQPVQTLREIKMLKFMEYLTDRPRWFEEIFDPDIADQWKKEALESDCDITPNMADWIIDELCFKAKIYERTGALCLYNGDVVKSDIAVPESLRHRLTDAVRRMPTISGDPIDPHAIPFGSSKQRDVIPVAMYPLVFGRSRILPDRLLSLDDALDAIKQGETIPCPESGGLTREDMAWRVAARSDLKIKPFSTEFQLLPCEASLGDDGKWRVSTYINNLHPVENKNLYLLFDEYINCMIPLWNSCLTPMKDMLHSRARIEYHDVKYHPMPKEVVATRPQPSQGETDYEYSLRLDEWRARNCRVVQPDCDRFRPWALPSWMMQHIPQDQPYPVRIEQACDINQEYGERGLQLIFRLMKIELNPGDDAFESDWHVEGQLNEHICAISVYVFDSDNIKSHPVRIRQIAETGYLAHVRHDPGDSLWLKQVFGLERGQPSVQVVGEMDCTPGRNLVFPSTLQHKVLPWALDDPSKSGHASILMTYLIDPNIRIISTANVPPQRADWTPEARELCDYHDTVDKLPPEMQDRMLDRKDGFPFTVQESVCFRDKMVEERINFTKYQRVAFESNLVFP